jgi:hypothetical protein
MTDFSSLSTGVNDELKQLVAQRLFEQMQAAKLRDMEGQRALQARGQDVTMRGQDFGREESQAQLGLGRDRLGLDRDKLGEDTRQFNAEAPNREAGRLLTVAQTGEIQRKPLAEQEGRLFTTTRDKTQHGYQMQEIGAQGANALSVANANNTTRVDLAGAKAAKQDANEVDDAISLIDQIGADPALNSAVGPVDQYVGQVHDLNGVNRFNALHNQLVGKLSLAQAGKLKGQGQISDKERALLGAAATALSRGLSEADYKNELGKVRAQFERMRGAAAQHQPLPAAGATANLIWDGTKFVKPGGGQ